MKYLTHLRDIVRLFAAFVLATLVVTACGGSSRDTKGLTAPVSGGEACSVDAEKRPSTDGCNTCTCVSTRFACTDMKCTPDAGSPGSLCAEGATKMQDCNACTCSGGQWGCSQKACPPVDCVDGATKNDGCNTCKCAGGSWACTRKYCPPDTDAGAPTTPKGCGGWLGDTCGPTEYCAYVDGQLCGAADASATCKPRPAVCDAIYAPVCGCNGDTYGSDCEAASKGTGVQHAGACK